MGIYISKVSKKRFAFGYSDYFPKTTNELWIENLKIIGLKYCKSYQENVSLFLAKRKLAEKNKCKARSCMLPYTP